MTAASRLPGGLAGVAIGFGISQARKKLVGSVFKKYRVDVLQSELKIDASLAEQSRRVLNAIKRRRTPSTIELPRQIADTFAVQLKPFG